MDLRAITDVLVQHPSLSTLDFSVLVLILRLCCLAKPALELGIRDRRAPPSQLPNRVLNVIVAATGQPLNTITAVWSAFRHKAWDHKPITPSEEEIEVFNLHGLKEGIGEYCSSIIFLCQ